MNKLNLGCGSTWKKGGWTCFDHSQGSFFAAEAWRLPYKNESFDIVFSSHMLEHIPVQRMEETLSEINRILKPGGIFRFLTPDFYKICKAYVDNDNAAMQALIIEDSSGVPSQLGLAQAVLGFVFGPGFDNVLLSARGDEITACLGHISMLDFPLSSALLSCYGYKNIQRMDFCKSAVPELQEPWHYVHEGPVWKQPTAMPDPKAPAAPPSAASGFDRDPLISLIVECQKEKYVPFDEDAPKLYGGPYPRIRRSNQLFLIRLFTTLAKFINGILYWLNGLRRGLGF